MMENTKSAPTLDASIKLQKKAKLKPRIACRGFSTGGEQETKEFPVMGVIISDEYGLIPIVDMPLLKDEKIRPIKVQIKRKK